MSEQRSTHWQQPDGNVCHHAATRWCNRHAAKPVVVIDPADDGQIERLEADMARRLGWHVLAAEPRVDALRAALLSLIEPPKPDEPTDPKARVTDRRENIWRLLADGDWVCTSGPDIGEYLVWDQLAGDRGPVSIDGVPS